MDRGQVDEVVEMLGHMDEDERRFWLELGRALRYAPRGEGPALLDLMWRGYEQRLREQLARMAEAGLPSTWKDDG